MGSGSSKCFGRKKRQPIQEEYIQQEFDDYNKVGNVLEPKRLRKSTNTNVEQSPLQHYPQSEDNIVGEPMIEVVEKPQPVNADKLIEEGRVQELIEAIMSDVEIQCQWEPVNYAARCGQFELVNWLMMNDLTDIKSY